jgi:hypothetical protein
MQSVTFSSTMLLTDHVYNLSITGTHNSSGKAHTIKSEVNVTKFVDQKGYLHNYAVKEWFNSQLTNFINKA